MHDFPAPKIESREAPVRKPSKKLPLVTAYNPKKTVKEGEPVLPHASLPLAATRNRARSECFQILLKQLHRQRVVCWPAPAIALNAADQPLAVMVDVDQREMAVGAVSMALPTVRTFTVVDHRK